VVRHTVGRRINTLYHSRLGSRIGNPQGIDIFGQDWDNLIILDARRYDEFSKAKRRHQLGGDACIQNVEGLTNSGMAEDEL